MPPVPSVGFRAKQDPEGDSATFLAFNLPNEQIRRSNFRSCFPLKASIPPATRDNLWHYVPNWEHFLAFSTANSKKCPFTDPSYKGKVQYSIESIPYAENILGRTLVMAISVKMSQERLDTIRKAIEKAAKNI
ncbi:MAG: hypothetical protein MZU91_09150 [Desulfosudis oleivorans]|nr:hypothetical protein [Desulfosudis oleivorans]